MSEEPLALSKISPPPVAQGDYDAICAALMHTERGRWFLQEYARRNRSADTQLLLAAIERIEAVVRAERSSQAHQSFRSDLLEMAKAITRTRTEVAEIRSDAASRLEAARAEGEALPVPGRPEGADVFAAAERIRDVTWAMRGHGFDPSTCDQLEELAASILSASSLRDPTDRRAHKLSEVLQYLEHRIDTLLESCAVGEAARELERDAFEPAPAGNAGRRNGSASASVMRENDAADPDSSRAPPPSRQIRFHGTSMVDDALNEGDPAARSPPPAVEIAPPEPAPAPDRAAAAAEHGDIPRTSGKAAADAEPSQPPDGGTERAPEPPISGPAEPASFPATELLAAPPPAAVPAQGAATPMPQPSPSDPLAALKAMSDEERIALFT